jgi:predicted GH43/DUF377 family glycosyl hydrolase
MVAAGPLLIAALLAGLLVTTATVPLRRERIHPITSASRRLYTASVVSFGTSPVLSYVDGTSEFLFAFNPSWVAASSGTQGRAGLLVRAQNCSIGGGLNGSYLTHCGPHCAGGPGSPRGGPGSPSHLAFAELLTDDGCHSSGSGAAVGPGDAARVVVNCTAPKFKPIDRTSVIFEPHAPSEIRGTEDPRVTYDARTGLYYLLYTSAYHTHLATSKNPTRADSWTRYGPICRTTACSKSGALLLSDSPSAEKPHYLFHSAGQIFVTHTADAVTSGNWANSTLFIKGTAWGNTFVESGPPPMRLSTGDYIYFINSWHLPDKAKGQEANVYEPAWVVLDGKNLTKIVAQASHPLFGPNRETWMRGHPSSRSSPVVCNTAEVAFVEAAHRIGGGKDLFRLYFGGADAVVGTAVVNVSLTDLRLKSDDIDDAGGAMGGTPAGVPLSTDCALRAETLAFAKTVVPRTGGFAQLFDALQLRRCNATRPPAVPTWVPPSIATPRATAASVVVFVDARRGSDSGGGRGSQAQPLRSLEAAIARVRQQRRGSGQPAGNATILLRKGVYYLHAPIVLTATDSWLLISNFGAERAEISGGQLLTDLHWRIRARNWAPSARQLQPGVDTQMPSSGGTWILHSNSNNVFGKVRAGRDAPCCKYVATTSGVAACERELASSPKRPSAGWQSFTWQPLSAGPFAGQCYGVVTDLWSPHAQRGFVSGRHTPMPPQPTPPPPPPPVPIAVADVGTFQNVADIRGLRVDGQRAVRARYPNIGSIESQPYAVSGPLTGYIRARTSWKPPKTRGIATSISVSQADWPSVEWPMNASDVDPTVPGVPPSETGAGDQGYFVVGAGGPCEGELLPPIGYSCSLNGGPRHAGQHMHPSGLHGSSMSTLLPNSPYKNVSAAVIHAWRPAHWFTVQYSVAEDGMGGLNFTQGGNQGAEGFNSNAEWWIDGLEEELDAKGEFLFLNQQLMYRLRNSSLANS